MWFCFSVSDISLQPAKASVFKGRNFKPTKAWFSGNRQSCRHFGFPEISAITAPPNSLIASTLSNQEVRLFVFLAFFISCCNIFVIEVLLGDVGAGKSSLVLRFVKEQFVEFQQSAGILASDIDSGSMPKQGCLIAILTQELLLQLGFHNINNPYVDMYFHCTKDAMSIVEFHKTLMNQVLPLAWSHNPLTTHKLICNFIDRRGDGEKRNQDEAFFTAAVWLHQNHSKTLAYNLVPISGSFGHILHLPYILLQVLRGEAHLKFTGRTREEADSNGMVKVKEMDAKSEVSELLLRRKVIHTANKAAQKYKRDVDYCFLHNCVLDIFAQSLKFDIEKFHHHKDHDHHDDYCLEITQAVTFLPTISDHHMLFENIARKVFRSESCL
ncbi:uncharacterized protein LOC108866025 isoform X2 [Pyrus x bretschneideri]|uniref:uncharacterized protein LOC108866025 isoform X2 n=1 Tax=Pyrus x bretschneideri TaxID=225117 RepID=UPI002030E95B|nr:uncharacterized protein LOC108866025 isoform X2 [Pyrus x bretschneideri]